ncbi:MAG: ECF transporter S component [Clostridiales bacterium]|nr:ECF transporter S component [Clostridiales bacterium]HBM79543.1 ECF transporter S component [Clostridiaceae bacterium]
MEKISNTKKLTRSAMLLAFAFVIILIGAQFGGVFYNQFIVAPIVNASILAAVLFADTKYGVLVGLLTPVLALITGQFNIPPFTPFIMVGNALLALSFGLSAKYFISGGKYIGIIIGAIIKALFLSFSVNYLVSLFGIGIPAKVISKLKIVMSYNQAYTALAGGIIVLLLYEVYKRVEKAK